METGVRSATADFAALMRAAHHQLDHAPKLLEDSLALRLGGLNSADELLQVMGKIGSELAARLPGSSGEALMRDTRAAIAVRSCIAEGRLRDALARGVRQYVILGAGLDSSAYRLARELEGCAVFEVDFPATQEWKRARLQKLGISERDSLHFVAIDFEKESLFDRLQAAGFDLERPAFFSWMGVVWYLSEPSFYATLKAVAGAAPGSEIVFEYPVSAAHVQAEDRPLAEMIRMLGAARGEPVGPGFDPAPLVAAVRDLGFDTVTDLSYAQIQARYFDGRSDGLRMPGIGHLMIASRH